MIIDTPDLADTTGLARRRYDDDLANDGFVFAHTRAMAVNPEALQAFEDLIRAVVPSIGLRSYELATLAAARAIGSTHCMLAHARRSLRVEALSEDEVSAVLDGSACETLTASDRAIVEFATQLSSDASAMTDADTLTLRNVGFSDRQIVDITLAASVRNYFSRALQALAAPIDEVTGLPARITEAAHRPHAG